MLVNAKTLLKYKLNATDEEVGGVKEFFFDDRYWTVRYLIANTGTWLSKRQVLISPYFLGTIDHTLEFINVNLTKREIEDSPTIDSDKPVSRQFEESYYNFYGAPTYWGGPSVWGALPTLTHDRDEWKKIKTEDEGWDPDLRSSKDVTGHNIQASDGEIGHVEDFIIDDESWTIRYLVIDTRNFLPGKKVLVSPEWIDRISWEDSKVFIDMTMDQIRNAPEYDPDELPGREYETQLYGYYNRPGYWTRTVYGDYSNSVHEERRDGGMTGNL